MRVLSTVEYCRRTLGTDEPNSLVINFLLYSTLYGLEIVTVTIDVGGILVLHGYYNTKFSTVFDSDWPFTRVSPTLSINLHVLTYSQHTRSANV